MKYGTVLEVLNAIENGEVDTWELSPFDCKGELFINGKDGERLFSAYYGTHNACEDVCTLLGLSEPEKV